MAFCQGGVTEAVAVADKSIPLAVDIVGEYHPTILLLLSRRVYALEQTKEYRRAVADDERCVLLGEKTMSLKALGRHQESAEILQGGAERSGAEDGLIVPELYMLIVK